MPNTKTKKFDFQIFLAVLMILLVICCATVCVVLGNTEIGVARAEGEVVNHLTNIEFETTTSFYLRNFTIDEIRPFIDFICLGQDGVMSQGISFVFKSVLGKLTIDSNKYYFFECEVSQVGDFNAIQITFRITDGGTRTANLFSFMYDYVTPQFYDYTVADNDGVSQTSYTFNINSLSSKSWFQTLLGATYSPSRLYFNFNTVPNLGALISPNNIFATYPSFGDTGQIEDLQNQITALQDEITRLNGIIASKDNTIDYYEALMPQTETVAVFDISKCVPSTFVYNGVTYSSDTIVTNADGWDIYDSRYNNKELPANHSVGFSLLLTETLNNTKIHINPSIQPWYSYNYDGGSRLDKLASFSVGFRNQNGQIVKLGNVMVDLVGNNEFIINQPTNEIVFFAPECNRIEVGKGMGVSYYKINTKVLYDEAYAEGYKTGYGYGKYIGKNEGIEQASDYSFFSLFSAVFDAPITAIVGRWGDSDGDGVYQREGGLLNFYIPGLEINFAPFLLSIFTLAIIVMIIRFILAKKS